MVYGVTIFEKYNSLGGILVHGIPEYRLNTKVVEESIKNILDFYVQNQFVYGCFHPIKKGESRYFILNTATHQLHRYSSSKEYANALNSYSLKNGFISDSINILEIRSGFKKVYW